MFLCFHHLYLGTSSSVYVLVNRDKPFTCRPDNGQVSSDRCGVGYQTKSGYKLQLPDAFSPRFTEMAKRQRPARLQRLDRDVAANLPHDRHLQELADEEALTTPNAEMPDSRRCSPRVPESTRRRALASGRSTVQITISTSA